MKPMLSAGSLFSLRFFSVAESTLGTLFSYGFCMIHGLLYTLVAFLLQEGGGWVLFIWRFWSITVGNTWQGVGVPCVCSEGVERDEHSTDTQPVPFVRSATLVLSAWLNLPGDTDRGVCPG